MSSPTQATTWSLFANATNPGTGSQDNGGGGGGDGGGRGGGGGDGGGGGGISSIAHA